MNEEYYSNMKANWRKIIQKMPIRDCMGFELWRMNRGFLSVFFSSSFSSSYNLILFLFILLVFYFLRNVLKRVVFKRMDWWFWLALIMYGFSFPFKDFYTSLNSFSIQRSDCSLIIVDLIFGSNDISLIVKNFVFSFPVKTLFSMN